MRQAQKKIPLLHKLQTWNLPSCTKGTSWQLSTCAQSVNSCKVVFVTCKVDAKGLLLNEGEVGLRQSLVLLLKKSLFFLVCFALELFYFGINYAQLLSVSFSFFGVLYLRHIMEHVAFFKVSEGSGVSRL